MDGIMVLNIIWNEFKVSIFIVVLMVNVFLEDKEECLKVGMNDFLIKFLNKGVLFVSICLYI